jgi:hypothetical protein
MMAKNKATREYQQSLIDAYYDFRMHKILDPLCESFQQWKAGELTHDDVIELIHKVHKEHQKIFSLFSQGRDWLITCIQMDTDWYSAWLKNNPLPPGLEL